MDRTALLDLRLMVVVSCKPAVGFHDPGASKNVSSHRIVAVVRIDVAKIELGAELFERLRTLSPANFKMRIGAAALEKFPIERFVLRPGIDGDDPRVGQEEQFGRNAAIRADLDHRFRLRANEQLGEAGKKNYCTSASPPG